MMPAPRAVFFDPRDPQAGVLAQAFRRAERRGPRVAAVQAAASDWWTTCAGVRAGRLTPAQATLFAMDAGHRHGVGQLVQVGLAETIGPENAADAEETWSEWAWRTSGDVRQGTVDAAKTLYRDSKAGASRAADDLEAAGRNILVPVNTVTKLPEKLAEAPADWFREWRGPITAGVVTLGALGALYILTRE